MRVPSWALAIMLGSLLAAFGWGATEIINLKASYAAIDAKLTSIKEAVDDLREVSRRWR